jgi:hypothetical protein
VDWGRSIGRLREASSSIGRRFRGLCPIWCISGLEGNIKGLGGLVRVPIGGFRRSCRLLKRRKACKAWIDGEVERLDGY